MTTKPEMIEQLQECMEYGNCFWMTEWEVDFIESLVGLDEDDFTYKQESKLEEIHGEIE